MFYPAEAAGLTLNLQPETRDKTSLYSMLGVVGQSGVGEVKVVWRGRPRPRDAATWQGRKGRFSYENSVVIARSRARAPAPHNPMPSRPECPVQRPVLNGFRDVFGLDCGCGFQVGNRPGYFEDAVVGAGGHAMLSHGAFEQTLAIGG